ncbi:hypothetical protein ACIA8R_52780 [Nonomuraea sp. NPDC051191]|uniref:hypothetical protein n=1 Tax=Nonomuraea sp. NPDC051191 TaxID=3364372 RepID=UPI00379E1485
MIVLLPLFVITGFIGWISASPEGVPIPVIVAAAVLGPSVFVAAVLGHRSRRRRANVRSLFDR